MSENKHRLKGKKAELGKFWKKQNEDSANESPKEFNEAGPGSPYNPWDYYEIGEIIATGGLKEIYRARDKRTGRDVAMAKLRPDHVSPQNTERFLREARTLSVLEHSNIVPMYEINYDSDASLFFIMKLLTGETLSSVIKNLQDKNPSYIETYTQRKLLGIFIRICDAIIYAHSKGIVHLDLKPENIQISEYGEVSVIDWGMAKRIGQNEQGEYHSKDLPEFTPLSPTATMAGNISGTPGYMSPEQAKGEKGQINESSDIYSLGALLYTVIYRSAPYNGFSAKDIVKKTANGELPDFPEKQGNTNISQALRAISKMAMMPTSQERYKDVQSLQQDVTLYLNDFATQAENINMLKLCQLFIRRQKRNLIIAGFIAAIIASITGVSYVELSRKEAILRAQNIRVNATAEEIITGTLNKHKELRKNNAYDEILSNYEKLRAVGYNYPEFQFDEALIHIGNIQFIKALPLLDNVHKSDSPLREADNFQKTYRAVKKALNIPKSRKLSFEEIIDASLNMGTETQAHMMWSLNRDPNTPLDERVKRVRTALLLYNGHPDHNFNFNYSITNGHVKVELINNFNLIYATPLYGLPMHELNISGTPNMHLGLIREYLRDTLSVFNLSGHNTHFNATHTSGGKFHTIIAKGTIFATDRLDRIPNLKYLDIEGANVRGYLFHGNKNLEHINVAFTKLTDYNFLETCDSLQTLIIDHSMSIPAHIKELLKERNVNIKVLETLKINYGRQLVTSAQSIPGTIQAEDFANMQGIRTKASIDSDKTEYVGWFDQGDFLQYNVNVQKSGDYKLTLRLAGRRFNLTLRNVDSTILAVNEAGTSDWEDWKSIHRKVTLPAGESTLTLECSGAGWNINWMKFELIE